MNIPPLDGLVLTYPRGEGLKFFLLHSIIDDGHAKFS